MGAGEETEADVIGVAHRAGRGRNVKLAANVWVNRHLSLGKMELGRRTAQRQDFSSLAILLLLECVGHIR